MTSDYESICRDHIREYGESTRLLELVRDLYSDRTHFIYELLQNAEDAAASYARFHLLSDRLEFSHDGRFFDTEDVKSICAAVASTKEQAADQIGKFGIGFKSVYALTATPEVHSGDEHFAIELYVRPRAAEPRPSSRPNETLFVFPFDRSDEPADVIHGDVERGFLELKPSTVLFLRKIGRVELCVGESPAVTLERTEEWTGSVRRISLSKSAGHVSKAKRDWIGFERAVQTPAGVPQRVEVAFALRKAKSADRLEIEPLVSTNLAAYFPTEKPTHLGFFVQGPFRTTPARDNIRQHDDWNAYLIAEIAELVVSALHELRRLDLLDATALSTLPLDPQQFGATSDLYPIFERVRAAMKTEVLLPTAGGGFVSAPHLALARGRGLSDLLSGPQLATLLGRPGPVEWQAGAISQDQTPVLWRYLRECLAVELVDPDKVANRLDAEFLAPETDAWIVKLYKFLLPHRTLRNLRERPIVRLEDGTHVTPFDDAGRPKCFLPVAGTDASLPTVRRVIAEDPDAREFLVALGIPEIDLVTEVTEHILPRYSDPPDPHDDTAQHQHDLQQIRGALDSAVKSRRDDLIRHLRATNFLRCTRFDEAATQYRKPPVYLRTPELECYFEGSDHAWYLDDDLDLLGDLLEDLGVSTAVRVIAGKPDRSGCIVIRSNHGDHERGLNGFDPRFIVDGLEAALRRPSYERSRYAWNSILVAYRQHLAGEVETATHQDYSNGRWEHRLSRPAALARELSWIPRPDGQFARPCDIDFDELPADFIRDRSVGDAVGMRMPALVELSRTVGVSPESMQQLRDNPQLAAEVEQFIAKRSSAPNDGANGKDGDGENSSETEPRESLAPTDAPEYLQALFARPTTRRAAGLEDAEHVDRPIGNPALRRSRIREEIIAQVESDRSAGKAFRRVPRKVWERKDSTVRQWLLNEYEGRCQICGYTFTKRDAEWYFEGLSLVPFSAATWADRVGNVLCLCANCCARFQHGPVEADDVLTQIEAWQAQVEGGTSPPVLRIRLGDEEVAVRFSERHFLDLQELLRAAGDSDYDDRATEREDS